MTSRIVDRRKEIEARACRSDRGVRAPLKWPPAGIGRKEHHASTLFAVATILALALALAALIAPGAAARDRTELFLAKLQGFKEVPGPGDPDGSGKAYITLVNNRACWVINWFGIAAPTAAHIHIGRPAQAGPVVQLLFAGPQGVPAPIDLAGG